MYRFHCARVRVLLVVAQIRWIAALTLRFHSQTLLSVPAARKFPAGLLGPRTAGGTSSRPATGLAQRSGLRDALIKLSLRRAGGPVG